MSEPIIEVRNVTMRFNLAQEKTDSIKEYVLKLLKKELRFNEFFALRDISFQVKKGDSIALIGSNGSGKSTMLKLIAGVLSPTFGDIKVNGTIAPMIELGAGFDIELTARENIYLNGAVMGHNREYMNRHFDNIVAFSELENFLDVPVKNFSSGMIARLGFAIATETNADILIVDEILAVGDAAFQEKCKERIKTLLANGTTLLFVSHNAEQVKSLCKKALWINKGKLEAFGPSSTICDMYRDHVQPRFDT